MGYDAAEDEDLIRCLEASDPIAIYHKAISQKNKILKYAAAKTSKLKKNPNNN
jgi:hypothetical protein